MKESIPTSSSHNKMIDGNWVLKRKRKRVLCRPDLSRRKDSVSSETIGKDQSKKPISIISRSGKKTKENDEVRSLFLLIVWVRQSPRMCGQLDPRPLVCICIIYCIFWHSSCLSCYAFPELLCV